MADHKDFLEAFLNCQPNLRAFIRALVRDRMDSDDVFQETAMTLWQKYGEYDPQRSFSAWAKGIAAKKVLQHRTRTGRAPTPFSPATINTIVEALERAELRQPSRSAAVDALHECVETLSEYYRGLLVLYYRDDWSMAEIAEHVGATPMAIRKAVSRVRKRLYDCVEQQLDHRVGRSK